MWISLKLIRWKPIPTLNFQMIHLQASFPAKNTMSYSFWNVYRWELEAVGGGHVDYYNHPKWVPSFLLSQNIFLTFSVICPWPLKLIVILISLSLLLLTTLWVTLVRHLASYTDILPVVRFHSAMYVGFPCQMKSRSLWGQQQTCSMLHLIYWVMEIKMEVQNENCVQSGVR